MTDEAPTVCAYCVQWSCCHEPERWDCQWECDYLPYWADGTLAEVTQDEPCDRCAVALNSMAHESSGHPGARRKRPFQSGGTMSIPSKGVIETLALYPDDALVSVAGRSLRDLVDEIEALRTERDALRVALAAIAGDCEHDPNFPCGMCPECIARRALNDRSNRPD